MEGEREREGGREEGWKEGEMEGEREGGRRKEGGRERGNNRSIQEYIKGVWTLPTVMLGLIISGSFFMSARAANGMPQLATTDHGQRRGIELDM